MLGSVKKFLIAETLQKHSPYHCLSLLSVLTTPGKVSILLYRRNGFFLGDRRIERMEMPGVSLVYSDEKFEVWVDTEKDNITLSMTDRGVTVLFTREEWLEFQEVIGNIMLEEEEAEEAP